MINILSNPVSGTNLLTVAANGAIIGVQQTVGYLNNHTSASTNTQKKSTQKPQPKKFTVVSASSVSPNEAQKVPAKSPALPQATTTVTSAQEKGQHVKLVSTSSSPMMPKINAVFTLADSGITSDTLNEHTKDEAKEPRVPTPDELTVKVRSVVRLETSKEKINSLNQGSAATGAPKFRVVEASISSTKTLPTQVTTQKGSSDSLKSVDSIVSGLASSKSNQCSVPKGSHKTTQMVQKPTSAASKPLQTTKTSNVATSSVKILEKGIAPSSMSQCSTTNVSLVEPVSVGKLLACPSADIAHKCTERMTATKESTPKTNLGDQQSASNILKQFVTKQAQDILVDSSKMTSTKNLVNQLSDVSCDSSKEVSSNDLPSYSIKKTPLITSSTKVPPTDSPTKVPPIDSPAKAPSLVLEKQSKELLSDLTKVITKNVHNVLADVQNKVNSKNQEPRAKLDVQSRGIKRKADDVVILADASIQSKLSVSRDCETNVEIFQAGGMKRKADDSVVSHDSKKRKIAANSTPHGASQGNPLKVKFTWNKRWTFEAKDEIVPETLKSEPDEPAKLEPPSTPSAPVVGDSSLDSQPQTPIKENPIPNKGGLIPKKGKVEEC